ncbi:hypothetical protein BJ085DRAFT_34720, partial [Dimargaris cristalligena]
VTDRELDLVIDRVNDLNTDTPKVRSGHDSDIPISADLIFGIDTQLFSLAERAQSSKSKSGTHSSHQDHDHHSQEIDRIEVHKPLSATFMGYPRHDFEAFLTSLPKEDIYRVKGLIRIVDTPADSARLHILNFAFGRYTLTPLLNETTAQDHRALGARLTVMGQDLAMHRPAVARGFQLTPEEMAFYAKQRTYI